MKLRVPIACQRGILAIALAANSAHAEDRKAAVASLKIAELAEFDDQSKAVRTLLASALKLTRQNLGYRYGSSDPTRGGMDCSGTIHYLLRSEGFSAPRSSHTIYQWLHKNGNLQPVEDATSLDDRQFDSLRPGDLLFWEGTYNVAERSPPISHVMIFLGHRKNDGKPIMMGASSGRSYDGKARHGVSVFDFKLPRAGSKASFVGYGPVPGVRKLPVSSFHDVRDEIISLASQQKFHAEIERLGGTAHPSVIPKGSIIMPAYRTPELYQWLHAQRKSSPATTPPEN